jgi:hypothetical protein
MGFTLSLQGAIYSALTGNTALMALVQGVYDAQPRPLTGDDALLFPYVTIGDDTLNDWSTDTESGADATITIHTWSRYKGRKEEKTIQAAIYDALHRQALTVSGYALVSVDWINSDSMTDADGETRHGVQTFRMILDQA